MNCCHDLDSRLSLQWSYRWPAFADRRNGAPDLGIIPDRGGEHRALVLWRPTRREQDGLGLDRHRPSVDLHRRRRSLGSVRRNARWPVWPRPRSLGFPGVDGSQHPIGRLRSRRCPHGGRRGYLRRGLRDADGGLARLGHPRPVAPARDGTHDRFPDDRRGPDRRCTAFRISDGGSGHKVSRLMLRCLRAACRRLQGSDGGRRVAWTASEGGSEEAEKGLGRAPCCRMLQYTQRSENRFEAISRAWSLCLSSDGW